VVARAVAARAGERILDLAAGTGTSTMTFAASGADCVACDFSIGMLRAGSTRVRAHPDGPQPAFVGGDALRLPFGDELFDAVTISFGLRNVADTQQALTEMLRVTRPGGRLVICEFSQLSARPLRILYERYLARALPVVARRVSRNPAAYDYLAESIVNWPAQAELARMLRTAGWSAVEWHNLTLGIVAVHVARRPKPDPAS
jgi:demethylmenaquinone methyltransferase/2-methoxy-6-polyprenyl-1,4-benzoquinol methylase